MKDFANINRKETYKKSGIYLLNCNNRPYIGSSNNLYRRLLEHKYELKKGKHSNDFMQNIYNKYGIDTFEYLILEYCNPKDRIEKEKYYIEFFNSDLNLQKCPVLKTLSKYSKEKLSSSILKGRKEGRYVNSVHQNLWNGPINIYDFYGNKIGEYLNVSHASVDLNISEEDVKKLCGGYTKGLIFNLKRLKYKNSKVKDKKFSLDSKIGNAVDFYCNEKIAFTNVKDFWPFMKNQVDLLEEEGLTEKEITIKIKIKNLNQQGKSN